jgi:ABC-type nickel/cobalt efflux system permease component RcnA
MIRKAETLKTALILELNGRRLELETGAREVRFTPGVGGLPTMKLGVVYRVPLETASRTGPSRLRYRDDNFPERTGWKEVVAIGDAGIVLAQSSVPDRDRSRELTDYPTDPLDSPPQVLEASIAFGPEPPRTGHTALGAAPPPMSSRSAAESITTIARADIGVPANNSTPALSMEPNRRATRRDSFADLVATPEMSAGILLFAALVAAMLGAVHALEPGHGKTVIAAYLVGARGTAVHALLLGLIVTASHTAGVYLLGGVTLYASRYVVPERLYPWLGAFSGLVIAGLGIVLFLKRYGGRADHPHVHGHTHAHHAHGHHHVPADGAVSLRALFALGISGGIVPCPAALVVLLSAVAVRRVGFGLFLIVAFSVGLAAVLIAIGLLMVYARRLMARFRGEGPLITRWLPLASSAVVTLLGVAIAMRALMTAGILELRLS